MYTEEPTDLLALKVWWATVWRALPISFVAGAVVGAIIGIIVAIMGSSPEAVQAPAGLAGFLIGIFVMVKVIKRLMTNGFGEYRLAVIKK
tara:strand:- start:702 stop:971 length:270 start_codon:yes stop_codon:yes gene_type:complete